MARDTWQLLRKVIRIGKIRKTITIPAASYNCGPTRGCLSHIQGTSSLRPTSASIAGSTSTVTLDFWAKQFPSTQASWYLLRYIGVNNTREISIQFTSASVIVTAITSASTYTITIAKSFFSSWHRLTVTFSSSTNLLAFYVDGVLQGSIATTGNLNDTAFTFYFGDTTFLSYAAGNVAELAIYSVAKDAESILQTSSYRGNVGTYGSSLAFYWKLNTSFSPTVGAETLQANASLTVFDSTDYPPILFGASFIVAQTDITLGKATSLIFPKAAPSGLTGQFCVSWTDRNGDFQRRKLWTTDGADIDPQLVAYAGERLESPFRLELWNIDGEATCVIPSDVVFQISDCTNPQTSIDQTQIAAVTPTVDSTLAQAFPLTPFPLTFNTQQIY